jgi:hypothetical protein
MVAVRRSLIVLGAAFLAALSVVGQRHGNARPETPFVPQEPCLLSEAPSRTDSIVAAVFEYGLRFGQSRADLRASLGEPAGITSRARLNPYSTLTDSLFTWTYDGLTFGFYLVAADGREFLVDVQLTRRTKKLEYGIGVDSTTRSDIIQLLQQPQRQGQAEDTTILAYLTPCIGPDEYIEFYFVTDTLRKIHWDLFFE